MDDISEIISCDKDACGLYIHSLIRNNSSITWKDVLEILELRQDKFNKQEIKELEIVFTNKELYRR
jgi:hypothetical protein